LDIVRLSESQKKDNFASLEKKDPLNGEEVLFESMEAKESLLFNCMKSSWRKVKHKSEKRIQ
jgi:hypothetical protein